MGLFGTALIVKLTFGSVPVSHKYSSSFNKTLYLPSIVVETFDNTNLFVVVPLYDPPSAMFSQSF